MGLVGNAVGIFAATIAIAAVWLLICFAIPPLRRRPKISYGIAAVLAVLVVYSTAVGAGSVSFVAHVLPGILVLGVLWIQFGRAKRKLLESKKSEADTLLPS